MSDMMKWIETLWRIPRDLVSDGFDQALYHLAQEVPMTIHQYPSGTRCWTWVVPEKWTCDEAYLETLDGKRLLDFKDNPLHVVSYSLPFEGVVERETLLSHVHSHELLPGAIPFVFHYYQRDWGLCMAQTERDQLTDAAYRVVIRTRFEPGLLKVGEIVVPGESDDTLVLAAHLCHPAMVNDDLTGVVVAVQAAKALLSGPRPYFTYRVLIFPETIGSVAYLSSHEALIPNMQGGLFLEMLGNDSAHNLQGSFQPNSQADRVFTAALRDLDGQANFGAYRSVINNDERQFNSPGVRVPMLSLSRAEPAGSPTRPYREYHSSLDTPEIISDERLESSVKTVLGLISAWERNAYLVNHFKGEVFCSGYGIWVDYRENPEGHRQLFEIMERCDGEHTAADIAVELGISFEACWAVVRQMLDHGLVSLSRCPVVTDPHRRTG